MILKFIEATDGTEFNYGKFMVARFVEEWVIPAMMPAMIRTSLLRRCGWDHDHLLVVDLQTGEGAIFRPGGSAAHDLNKHKIWVCPMYEPFLAWLYKQDLKDLSALPATVNLGDVPTSMSGYRREGPAGDPRSDAYVISYGSYGEPTSIMHYKCGMRSHNANDVAHRYCGWCHVFLDLFVFDGDQADKAIRAVVMEAIQWPVEDVNGI